MIDLNYEALGEKRPESARVVEKRSKWPIILPWVLLVLVTAAFAVLTKANATISNVSGAAGAPGNAVSIQGKMISTTAPNNGEILSYVSATGLWTPAAAAAGGVTSVAMTVPAFLSIAGSPVTTTGTLAVTLSGTALPIANGGTARTTRPTVKIASCVVDGFGAAPSTGVVFGCDVEIPANCTVTGWYITSRTSGSIVLDVWVDDLAAFPPTVADTYAGSEKPTLSAATFNSDVALSTWTTALVAGDIVSFNVDSASTLTTAVVTLVGTID